MRRTTSFDLGEVRSTSQFPCANDWIREFRAFYISASKMSRIVETYIHWCRLSSSDPLILCIPSD
eukprot:766875-Hanusia_phi.AAC.2